MIDENHVYDQDGLRTSHNHDFMNDDAFQAAYARGVAAYGRDFGIHWRLHTCLWAARTAMKTKGDFVECGVSKGFMSSAICKALDWSSTGRTFFLLDTFSGIDTRYVSEAELEAGAVEKDKWLKEGGFYADGPENVIKNFSEWQNIKIVVGPVPETLGQITAKKIAYLHLDMNSSPPEVATMSTLWDRLSTGAVVVLDDYAYAGYRHQRIAMDDFAKSKGISVLSVPTGQGVIVKSPTRQSFLQRLFDWA